MQVTNHDQDREEMSWIKIFFYCALFFVAIFLILMAIKILYPFGGVG